MALAIYNLVGSLSIPFQLFKLEKILLLLNIFVVADRYLLSKY